MSDSTDRKIASLKALATIAELGDINVAYKNIQRELAQRSLYQFIKQGWRYIDPAPFVDGWHIQAICEHLDAVLRGELRHLIINMPPRCMKSSSVSVALAPWSWCQRSERSGSFHPQGRPPHPPLLGSHMQGVPSPLPPSSLQKKYMGPHIGPQTSFMYASYGQTLSMRDSVKARRLIDSPWYQENWGNNSEAKRFLMSDDSNTKTRFDNSEGGYRIATSVGGSLTGEGADVIILDDPHNAVDIESDAVREGVLSWYDESMSTRLNNPKTGSYIVVMQRLHDRDLSGHIMSKAVADGDWTLLRLPMEYEPRFHCSTKLPWSDPRGLDEEGELLEGLIEGSNGLLKVQPGSPMEDVEGKLLWPARFGRPEVDNLKRTLGPHACTPAESPILMSDLSFKPISEVKIGDEVVGFTTDNHEGMERKSLVKSKILKTYSYMADVVKITLSSGKVIRCTPDHKWYMGKEGGHRGWRKDGTEDLRPLYRPAIVGRKLMRISPDSLPVFSPEEIRMAGWLGGFFDGDGSASNCEKRRQTRPNGEKYKSSIQISLHQTEEKNLPICERIDEYLEKFGFAYNIYRRDITKIPNSQKHWQSRRHYQLTVGEGNTLTFIQKFLHVFQPAKWRQRIIDAAYTANFISAKEEVVKIEPDGNEPVYALETETGNYVVWGIASANSSGQLQQNPVPRGGAIIKEDWWQLFPPKGEEVEWTGKKWNGEEYVDVINFPQMEYVIVYADTAYTEAEENDYSAAAMIGVWRDKNDNAKLMLMRCWQERLELHKLVHKLAQTCRLGPKSFVDKLIIENKASGKSVAQEIIRLFGNENWVTQTADPQKGDKVARAYSVQYLFADKMVYAPARDWADLAIRELSVFPKGAHDDLCDSVVGAIGWLRKNGFIEMRRERVIEEASESMLKSKTETPYDC